MKKQLTKEEQAILSLIKKRNIAALEREKKIVISLYNKSSVIKQEAVYWLDNENNDRVKERIEDLFFCEEE
jgi:hypothetical protein